MANTKFYGTGRRKKSIARVYLVPGTGKITINKRDIDEYLGLDAKYSKTIPNLNNSIFLLIQPYRGY